MCMNEEFVEIKQVVATVNNLTSDDSSRKLCKIARKQIKNFFLFDF